MTKMVPFEAYSFKREGFAAPGADKSKHQCLRAASGTQHCCLVSKRTHMSRVLMRCSGIAAAPLLECARRAQGWVGLVGGKALAEFTALREHCLVRRFVRHQALIGVDIGVRVVCALYPVAHPLAVAPAV